MSLAYTDQLTSWSLRWMEAERDANPGKQARVAALEAHLKRLQDWELIYDNLVLGEGSGVTKESHAIVKFHRMQAEYWLAQEKL